ncbi:tRNA(adenine34) deaminase [Desulfonatronum thiosulfatophilum]|uniref:tRNA-specific adenosine deaminase n=2 Tax=Desulfonatronum thiosulfatophilum TaxID=617002 RepID=A0A1G6ATG6_9BACT|nr:tRNA(adenine34) deaminase [Desulfonatronum thiosulfatophilum]
MRKALDEARTARDIGEVPVGALVINPNGEILAAAHNRTESDVDPSGHAEILALRQAAKNVGNHRLTGSVLVATLEPCLMCLGAMVQARVAGLVFGARDPRAGAVLSRINVNDLDWLNHRFWVLEGVQAEESATLLREFFTQRRNRTQPTGSV